MFVYNAITLLRMISYGFNIFLTTIISLHFVVCGDDSTYGPLMLTPYLRAGKIKEAQEEARIIPDLNGVKSYSGFFTVNKQCGNNLFFWFLPAQNNWEEAPVLLWLNGGPGTSSLFGMFKEVGPFNFVPKGGIIDNEYHWTKNNNIVFMDQPVGTGFSFSEKGCFADNLTAVAEDVYSALEQFFILFPNLQKNKFFFTGESFAGHYIPAIAWEIHQRNEQDSLKINMKGFVIGNPSIDVRCAHTGSFLYQLGVIDKKLLDYILNLEKKVYNDINERDYKNAYSDNGEIFVSLRSYTNLPSFYNILYNKEYSSEFQIYVRQYEIRKLLHVGDTPYYVQSVPVFAHLNHSYFTPANIYLENLLKTQKYIVGFYNGQLDSISLYTEVPCVLRQLEWPGAEEYLTAVRTKWYVGGHLAGWFKVVGNLFEVVVRKSGHFVPIDQGRVALELITAAVSDDPGSKLLSTLHTEP